MNPGDGRAPELVFSCGRGEFAHTLLGAHDGRESWTLMVGKERSRHEQLLVSLHEKKHHELQQSSPWGLLMMTAGGPTAPSGVFRHLAAGCGQTHELFATLFSVGTDTDFLALLDGNDQYRRYYERAAGLAVPRRVPPSFRLADALLRAAMAPDALKRLCAADVLDLQASEVPRAWMPDARLRTIEATLADRDLELDELESLGTDLEGLVTFRDHVSDVLNQLGIPTMTLEEQKNWTVRLVEEIETTVASSGYRFQIETTPPPDRLESELDDLGRERLQFHDTKLPLEIVHPDQLRDRAADFARIHREFGIHSLMVWIRRDLLDRQFDVPPGTLPSNDRPVLGLLSCDRVHGKPVAHLCPFDAPPSTLFGLIGGRNPLLFLTTLATIIDTPEDADLAGITPVFALLDQPVLPFCQHTFEQGANLRWRVLAIDGDRDVSMFLFENDAVRDVYYLHFAAAVSRHQLGTWLSTQPAERCRQDASLADAHESALSALVEHVLGTFWQLNQFGARR